MKVLQINTVYRTGGSTGRIVYDLKKVMESYGIESYVAFGYGYIPDTPEQTRLFRIDTDKELFISKVQTKLIGHHGFNNVFETKRLVKWIEKINPDIIHLHNIHNHYVNIELLLTYIKKHHIPCVLTMHDCWTFTGHCAYFDYSGCNKWQTECKKCPNLKDYPVTYALTDPSRWNFMHKRKLFADLDITLVTPSKWLAELVKLSFLKEKHCMVINNGVDLEVFKPRGNDIKMKLGIQSKTMMLAMASGFTKRKGIDYLLKIPEMLADNEVLVLVGVKPEQKYLLPKERCIGIERTNNVNELAEYYSAADVFINTTLEDNFPTTNIEALACGTPVVTFNTGGSIESVVDGEHPKTDGEIIRTNVGAIVPQRNIELLLTIVRKICSFGGKKIQASCRTKAETQYEKIAQYMKYIKLYKRILGNKQ